MGLMRYDSSVDECCCLGLRSDRNALKSGSVFAGRDNATAFQVDVPKTPESAREGRKRAQLTFGEHLGHLGVAGAEGAVDLEAVGVVKERATQGEEHFLPPKKQKNP